MLFEDVPKFLEDTLRETLPGFKGNPYAVAAGFVCVQYLGKNFLDANADKFVAVGQQSDGGRSYEFAVRLSMVGGTLFNLRRSPSFPEICRRMRSSNSLQSACFEAFVAYFFSMCSFSIVMREEVGRRREDFDFSAIRGDETINVEVTALTNQEFSYRTVINALNRKRQQLPDTNPAIICCVIPEKWQIQTDINFYMFQASQEIFERSRRINAIVAITERHIAPTSNGSVGGLTFPILTFTHRSPRRSANLEFLFTSPAISPRNESIAELLKAAREKDEFYRWVDSLIDGENSTANKSA